MSTVARWTVRVAVLAAFVSTLWLAGPRAATVLAARFAPKPGEGPKVVLDRVGFVDRPDWLDQPLLLAIAQALSPWLSDEIGLLDDVTALRLRQGLEAVPWVEQVRIERVFPDRMRLRVGLRRPVLSVRAGDGRPLCLCDDGAVMLPWVDTELPELRLYGEARRPTELTPDPGRVAEDPRVAAAAAIAVEWRDQLAPLVPGCPRLVEIDATNLGELWLREPAYPELRVLLRRADGQRVVFGYGRPVDSPLLRVPVATKAKVLQQILARHPGLDGLVAGDLRFARRWLDYLQPRASGVLDPFGSWKELPPAFPTAR